MNKKLLFPLGIILLSSISLSAQESIGYTNPDDLKYLLDYQLPDWGYNNFYISSGSLGANGSYRFSDQTNSNPVFSNSETDLSNHRFNLGITPSYELYRESEARTFSINTYSGLSTIFSNSNLDATNSSDQNSLINYNSFNYLLSVANNYYVSNNSFLINDLYSEIEFTKQNRKIEVNGSTNTEDDIINRNIVLMPRIGFGIGRIRNVTPIIRAIRVNERYKELGNNSLSRNEILSTADNFTRVQGYQRTKERFQKTFWGDVNSGVNGKLDQLAAFDIFYLNDVFSENLGSRFEGYEAYVSVDYFYSNQLSKVNDQFNNVETRNFSISRATHVNLNYDWFKNLDLYNQISIQAENKLILPLERDDPIDWSNEITIDAKWLWNFADRFQLNSSFENSFRSINDKNETFDNNRIFTSQLRTNFYYFIENKVALNAGVSIVHRNSNVDVTTLNTSIKEFQWGLNAGISYYFNRNLY